MEDTNAAGWRTWPVRLAACAALLFVPVWYRLPFQPPIFTSYYVTRFALFLPLIATLILYAAFGFPGIRRLAADRWRAVWALLMLSAAIWMYASGGWAFRRDADPALATGAAVQFMVVTGCAVAAASVRLPASWVVTVLIFGLAWNALLAGQQVAIQGSAGGIWSTLGQFPIGVGQPRISVVQADSIRWLRPYGLLPHPNMLAGFLVVGLAAAAAWLTSTDWRRWLLGGITTVAGLWALLLTFSRGGYLALAVAGAALLMLLRGAGRWNRQLVIGAAAIVMVGGAFSISYYPYLLARAGEGSETTEQFSAGERAELNEVALIAIGESPLIGVGAGNLPWRSAYILAERETDVMGNYPHNVWLTVWGETGLVGVLLMGSAVVTGIGAAIRAIRRSPADSAYRAALLAGFIGLCAAGLFEYYPVTVLQFQTGWWLLAAAALAPTSAAVLES